MLNFNLNYYIIIIVAIVLFGLLQGVFGKFLQKFTKFLFNPIVLEYSIIVLFICLVLYFCSDIVFAMGNEGSDLPKPDIKVTDTNININNPNIKIPADPLVRGLANIGVGAAIAGGMNAATNLIKSSALPPAIKFGTMVAGGAAAGALVTATNAANSIAQTKISSSSKTSGGSNNTTGSGGLNSNITESTNTNTNTSTNTNSFDKNINNIDNNNNFEIDNIDTKLSLDNIDINNNI
jgi:hypothetical protein